LGRAQGSWDTAVRFTYDIGIARRIHGDPMGFVGSGLAKVGGVRQAIPELVQLGYEGVVIGANEM
jgi:hypothetical protein